METDSCENNKTVVVSGVPDVLPVSRMIDKLTIHFQSCRRSHGGDVEVVRYPANMDGVAFVTFDQVKDAERVVRKETQIMADHEFPEEYLLTVFPFTRDVYLYVPSATVDLSIFGRKQAPLIQSLRAAHRSVRFQPLLEHRKATIEGPFAAVKALREDLIRRASHLKQTAPLNPRPISHHRSVGSAVRSNSLSAALQTTGEATEVQSLNSFAKTQIRSPIPKVSCESLDAGSLYDTECNEKEKLGAQSSFTMPRASCVITEYRSMQATNPRQVFKEPEINAEIRASLSGLDGLPAEMQISAKQPGVDSISQKHTRPDRISATETRDAKLHQTRRSDMNTEDTGELCAVLPRDPKDNCVWVDSDTFRYIKRFDRKELDRCLRGLDASVECAEGTDFTLILLTGNQTSGTGSRVQYSLERLKTLVESWQWDLRVHWIHFGEEEQPERQKLIQICDDANFIHHDVLYMFEDCSIKVVGPSLSSYLFHRTVKDRVTKLKDTFLQV